ncbi:hypothetical protein LTR70_010307 [Exophiala xenobiotica]|nr:hypothetical protein LTR70_010307 [Exophiala xenobiotica]
MDRGSFVPTASRAASVSASEHRSTENTEDILRHGSRSTTHNNAQEEPTDKAASAEPHAPILRSDFQCSRIPALKGDDGPHDTNMEDLSKTFSSVTLQQFNTTISNIQLSNFQGNFGVLLTAGSSNARYVGTQTPTKPLSTVSFLFERDSNFVGRTNILHRLDKAFKSSKTHRRVALHGLGGVGKSQIAIEYSYILREQDPSRWVFWVDASSAARFNQSFHGITQKLGVQSQENSRASPLELVSQWLRDAKNGPWIIILDSADNADVLFRVDANIKHDEQQSSVNPAALATYLPQSAHGAILITSRDRQSAVRLMGGHGTSEHIIAVSPFDEDDALLLFNKHAGVSDMEESGSRVLVKKLAGFPFAITQAAAYIKANGPRMSVARYITLFDQQDSIKLKLLSEGIEDLRRDTTIPDSVISTLTITLSRIDDQHPTSMMLLSLMSVLDGQSIPEYLIQFYRTSSSFEFEEDLAPLLRYSLVDQMEGPYLQVHALVQLTTRGMLNGKGWLDNWKRNAFLFVSGHFPKPTHHELRERCKELVPHAELVLQYDMSHEEDSLNRAMFLFKVGSYISKHGQAHTALSKIQESVHILERRLGKDNDGYLNVLNCLGTIYNDLGQYEEAERVCCEAFKTSEEVNGQMHRTTIVCANALAYSLTHQAKFDEARDLCRFAFEQMRLLSGDGDLETLQLASSLVQAHDQAGSLTEAEKLSTETLDICMKLFGPEHYVTLHCVSDKIVLLDRHGKYGEAEQLLRDNRERMQRAFGTDSSFVTSIDVRLASLLQAQGKYEEALGLSKSNLERREKKMGPDHPKTLIAHNDLASAYRRLDMLDNSETHYRIALEGQISKLGLSHPHTRITLENFGTLMAQQQQYSTLDEFLWQAVHEAESNFGKLHDTTLETYLQVAGQFQREGRYQEEERLLCRLWNSNASSAVGESSQHRLSMTVENHNAANFSTFSFILRAQLWDCFAHVLLALGRYDDLNPVYEDIARIYDSYPGDKRDFARATNIPMALFGAGRPEEAEKMAEVQLKDRESAVSKDSPSLVLYLSMYALILALRGKMNDAELTYRREVEIRERSLPNVKGLLAKAIVNLAGCVRDQDRLQEAEQLYSRGLALKKEALPKNDESTLSAIGEYASILTKQGKLEDAEVMYLELYYCRNDKYGPPHQQTLDALGLAIALLKLQEKFEQADKLLHQHDAQAV